MPYGNYGINKNPTGMTPGLMAGLSAGTSALQSIFGNIGRRASEKRARAHDINMWDKTNQYNHPSAQMARLRSAGLNPNLVYGGSSGQTAGTANSLPSANAPEYDMNLGTPFQKYYQIKNTEAQTNNLDAQSRLNSANTILANNKSKTELQNALNKGKDYIKTVAEIKNLGEINNRLIADSKYAEARADATDTGRFDGDDLVKQMVNAFRKEHPGLTISEMITQMPSALYELIKRTSPVGGLFQYVEDLLD